MQIQNKVDDFNQEEFTFSETFDSENSNLATKKRQKLFVNLIFGEYGDVIIREVSGSLGMYCLARLNKLRVYVIV